MEKIKYVSGNFENKIIQADNKLLIEKFLELKLINNFVKWNSSILHLHTCFLIDKEVYKCL